MAPKVIPIQEWLEQFADAATEVADSMLRIDGTGATRRAAASEDRPGAYIALMSERHSIHLGLTATPEDCARLARGLLGLRSDQSVPEQDVADSVREVMNIVAGKVKSKMTAKDGPIHLGLPIYLEKPAAARDGAETATTDVKLGSVDCRLIVYRSKRAA